MPNDVYLLHGKGKRYGGTSFQRDGLHGFRLDISLTSFYTVDRLRGMQSVDLFTFVLFLYIQQINKISLRASAVSASAE